MPDSASVPAPSSSERRVLETCRECRDEAEFSFTRPGEPAEFILWGKLFPPEALGPRCYHHTAKWIGGSMSRIDQYAVFDLRPFMREEVR